MRVYIDDLLHVTKGSWTEHISILKEMFTHLQKAGLKVNAKARFSGVDFEPSLLEAGEHLFKDR